MRFEDKTLIELFLGLVFVALLVVGTLVVVQANNQPNNSPSYNVENSYNQNSYNNYAAKPVAKNTSVTQTSVVYDNYRTIYLHDSDYTYRHVDYDRYYNYYHSKKDYKGYFSYGEHKKTETVFNNYKDEFRVHVVNKGKEDRYFKVKFYFCDYEKNCFIENMQKYIHAGEEDVFNYVDIHAKRYKYYDWEYKVFPEN